MPVKYLQWGHIKDSAYWQKSQGKEEHLEQIKESAESVREDNEVIRKGNKLTQKQTSIQKSRSL
jgi:hypothetical protein